MKLKKTEGKKTGIICQILIKNIIKKLLYYYYYYVIVRRNREKRLKIIEFIYPFIYELCVLKNVQVKIIVE